MNQTSTASIPMAIGNAVFSVIGRGVGWGVSRMLHAPMTSTAAIAVTGLSMMAAANALFMQDSYHPAPMFGAPATSRPAPVEPVIERPADLSPAPRPQPAAERNAAPAPAQTQTQAPAPQAEPAAEPVSESTTPAIGNADVAEMQRKLKEMGLFEGTVDGYYGPKTADAIRAFEGRAGLPRTGAATPDVMEAIRNAPLTTSEAPPQTEPQPQPRPVSQPMPEPVAAVPQSEDIAALITQSQTPASATEAAPTEMFDPAGAQQAEEQAVTASAELQLPAARDRQLVSAVQQGLAQLGFLQAPVDGVAGQSTAEAIRKFEIFHNYRTTGQVSRDLVDMLEAAGADL